MNAVSYYLRGKVKAVLRNVFSNFEGWFCQCLLAFFIGMIFLQIIFRFFSIAAPWTEELARFAFLWFVLFGACHAARLQVFNRVTVQFALLSPKMAAFCLCLADALWIVFSLVLAWQGVLAFLHLERFPCFSPGLDLNLKWIYLGFPASFFLLAIRIFQGLIGRFTAGRIPPSDRNRLEATQKNLLSSAGNGP